MKKKIRLLASLLTVMAFMLVLTNSCSKDQIPNSNNNGIIFNPNKTYGTLTDIDGNVYKTIQIDTQIWMAENLRVTHWNDGVIVPIDTLTKGWPWYYFDAPAYCYYNNNDTNRQLFGLLYSRSVLFQNICPTGWHVPSNDDWIALINYLDGDSIAYGKLKEIGTTHWLNPNNEATNESGFTALAGGIRDHRNYYNIGKRGYYWTSTLFPHDPGGPPPEPPPPPEDRGSFRSISNDLKIISWENSYVGNCLSIRCIKD